MLMLLCTASQMWAINYIKEVAVCGSSNSSEALQRLKEEGYTPVEVDLTAGKGKKIYLGYKTTTTYTDAVTQLLVMNGKEYKDETKRVTYKGNIYQLAKVIKCGDFTGDLNDGGGIMSSYLYLYYTKETLSEQMAASHGRGALTDVSVLQYGNEKSNSNYAPMFDGSSDNFNPDCNRGAGGSYVYIYQTKYYHNAGNELFEENFKVTHLGGKLFEFSVPVYRVDTVDNKAYLMAGNASTNYITWGASGQNYAVELRTDGKVQDLSKDWDNCTVKAMNGSVINPQTMSVVATGSSDLNKTEESALVAYNSDGKNYKVLKFLWMAPDSIDSNSLSFSFSGKMKEVGTSLVKIVTLHTTPELPKTDISSLTVTTPFIDTESSIPGWAKLCVVTPAQAEAAMVWDATDGKILMQQSWDEAQSYFSVSLPQHEEEHEISVMTYAEKTDYTNITNPVKTHDVFSASVRQKPFHSIHGSVTTYTTMERDSADIAKRFPCMMWEITNPNDSDLITGDQYIVERSYDENFSTGETVAAIALTDVIVADKTATTGEYRLTDNALSYNESATKTTSSYYSRYSIGLEDERDKFEGQTVYYRAYRALVNSIWGTSDSAYVAKFKAAPYDVLPYVTAISVEQADDWQTSNHVKLHVKLANPYPWEHEIFTSSGKTYIPLRTIAYQMMGDSARMFRWDSSANIKISRFSPDDDHYLGKDEAEKTLTIQGSNVKWDNEEKCYYAEIDDWQSLPYTHYYYKACVDNSNSLYPVFTYYNTKGEQTTDGEAQSSYHEALSQIAEFKASQGTAIDKVVLEWHVDDGLKSGLSLTRQEIKSPSTPVGTPVEVSITDDGYTVDEGVEAGKVYLYKLTCTNMYHGQAYSAIKEAVGYPSRYGKISGRVQMANGCNLPGKVQVKVERLSRDEVTTIVFPETEYGSTVIPEFTQEKFLKTVDVDSLGNYEVDSIPYDCNGWRYQVTPVYRSMVFTNSQGTEGPVEITLGSARGGDYKGVTFSLSDTYKVSGRILYANSTIPVSGVRFKVSGTTVVNSQKEEVVTDAMGNYSFLVPRTDINIQAYKDRHFMQNDGYILGSKNDSIVPTDNVVCTLKDSTTIRLAGRIAGGLTQGSKPVGLGLSQNNLGDSITLVLQLDGNNTSYTYFDEEKPDVTQRKETFTQKVMAGDAAEERNRTDVTFERKRIIITVPSTEMNRGTGEFAVDLAPAKYKITQMQAKGYTSFFNENEGYQVLDLTDSVDAKVITASSETTAKDAESTVYSTTVNAVYNRIYRAPITVSVKQSNTLNGADYLGERSVSTYSYYSNGNDSTALVEDSKIDLYNAKTGKYLLGYPVFAGKQTYTFNLTAEEQYLYNNTKTTVYMETVPYTGNLYVKNGLIDDRQETKTIKLDKQGCGVHAFTASNTTFSVTGEDALREFDVYADVNGKQYEAESIKAYVTGDRVKDQTVLASVKDADIVVNDVLRDPPGAKSYAYREKGTSYEWSYDSSFSTSIELGLNFEVGSSLKTSTGLGFSVSSEVENSMTIPSPTFDLWHDDINNSSYYTMELNEEISTSSSSGDEGAMADVYIGSSMSYDIKKTERICIIDKRTYQDCIDRFNTNEFRVIANSGDSLYLVTGEGITYQRQQPVPFVYTQEYIIETLIPTLEELNNSIGVNAWKDVIAQNEQDKYECYMNQSSKCSSPTRQAFSSGLSISHSEDASSYSSSTEHSYFGGISFSTGVSSDTKNKAAGKYTAAGGVEKNSKSLTDDEKKNEGNVGKIAVPGTSFSWELSFNADASSSSSVDFVKTYSAGTGYTLEAENNSDYIIDIYPIKASSGLTGDVSMTSDLKDIQEGKDSQDEAQVHSFIFVTRSGASRNPWMEPDSTYYYPNETTHLPLMDATLKIDNPKITIEPAVRNNVPLDGKATFKLIMSNESEISANTSLSGSFTLKVAPDSNPNGLKITLDGAQLSGTTGCSFSIAPGKSLTKYIEVERGQGYDFDDIRLQFSDNSKSLTDKATLSVHYMRDSSPVTISSPAQNWVLNTLSQTEGGKYYKPIKVTGFDTGYDNFDHVEIQYKRYTDDDSQWTNLISYYPDSEEFDSIYNAATGTKARMDNGTIPEYRFFGENDPEEMKYDLRAVTFCRQGTSYVSRASEVISGMKDTRCPEVFGKAKPTSGILTYEDVIALPFNEPIAYNYLDKTANFQIQGYINSDDANQITSLYFKGAESSAQTEVKRNMHGRSFTIDLMARLMDGSTDKQFNAFYTQIGDSLQKESNILFGVENQNVNGKNAQVLVANVRNNVYKSEDISDLNLTAGMRHYGLAYDNEHDTVTFYIDGNEYHPAVTVSNNDNSVFLPNSTISIGFDAMSSNWKGTMDKIMKPYVNIMDVRLWGRVLSLRDFVAKKGKWLPVDEMGLMAYWPMEEGNGDVAQDLVGGADLKLNGTQWLRPDSYSLKLNGNTVGLNNTDKLKRTETEDYTLSFWMKADRIQTELANIFSAGDDQLDSIGYGKMRICLKDSTLSLTTNDSTYIFSNEIKEETWYQVAVTTNHSQNTAALYLNGTLVGQYDGALFDGIESDTVSLGGNFYGNIDDFTFWHLALPANYLKEWYDVVPLGTEAELVMLLPFQYDALENGTTQTLFSPYNMVINKETGKYDTDPVIRNAEWSAETAPTIENTGLRDLDFSWTCTDNELQINILRSDYELNNQQVNITVRGVEDIYGNVMKNPAMWTVYYNRNVLQWNTNKLDVKENYGYGSTEYLTWQNKGGKSMSYTISTDAQWLKLSDHMGTVSPLEEKELKVTVSDALNPGEYKTNIYITDENNLTSRIPVIVNVEAEAPVWTATNNVDYSLSMSVKGQVKLSGAIDDDTRDMVAAYYKGVCLGAANITSYDDNKGSYVYLNIVGTAEMNNANVPLEFYLWDAATGTISSIEPDTTIVFKKDSYVGLPPFKPVTFTKTNNQIQLINVVPGWNWISLNVKPDPTRTLDVNQLFVNKSVFSKEDRIKMVGYGFVEFDGNDWMGDGINMPVTKDHVYQVYMNDYATLEVKGSKLTDADRVVTLKRGTNVTEKWNELPYLLDESKAISTALADYQPGDVDKVPVGTIVKSHDAFAVAGTNGWDGSLKTLRPGEGYYVKHSGTAECTIQYYSSTASAKKSTLTLDYIEGGNAESTATDSDEAQTAAAAESANNMPVMAVVGNETETTEGDLLVAYTKGTVVGVAELSQAENQERQPMFFLSVNAADGDQIRFALMRGNEIVGVSQQTVSYDATGIVGTLSDPYVISLGAADGENLPVYDLQGIRRDKDYCPKNSVVIQGNKKILVK